MATLTQETFQKMLDASLSKYSSIILKKFDELEMKIAKKMALIKDQLDENTTKIEQLSKTSELAEVLQKKLSTSGVR